MITDSSFLLTNRVFGNRPMNNNVFGAGWKWRGSEQYRGFSNLLKAGTWQKSVLGARSSQGSEPMQVVVGTGDQDLRLVQGK
ncbi:hypothetical protein PG987_006969 [Apiospora arundinis]